VLNQAWPVFDEALTVESTVTIVVQVNGKLRGEFSAPIDATQDQLKESAMSVDKVKPHLEGKQLESDCGSKKIGQYCCGMIID